MDRLSLFKLLADRSRYAIYQEVAAAEEPMSTNDIAERLALHPNTVRLHLEKMREAGLLEMSSDRHGSVGRPQHRWSAVPQAPSLGLEPAGFRLLAHLLAEIAAQPARDPGAATDAIADVGRACGRERTAGLRSRSRSPRAACLQAVMDELADLGFDPALEPVDGPDTPGPGGGLTRISFTHCPFRELAALYPDIVCQLHRGITEGILSGAVAATPGAAGRLESFGSLVDEDPCRAEMSLSI